HTRFSRDWSSDVCSSDLVRDDVVGDDCPVVLVLAGVIAGRIQDGARSVHIGGAGAGIEEGVAHTQEVSHALGIDRRYREVLEVVADEATLGGAGVAVQAPDLVVGVVLAIPVEIVADGLPLDRGGRPVRFRAGIVASVEEEPSWCRPRLILFLVTNEGVVVRPHQWACSAKLAAQYGKSVG